MLSETGILYSALAILVLPLASYVITFFFGKMLPREGDFVGVTFMGVSWYLAIRIFITFWQIGDPSYRLERAFTWLDIGGFSLDAGSLVDGMTSVMLMVVTTVSFVVHLYSTGYMKGDRRYERFFAFLGFFTFSMMGIVLANNLFFLYVFWELVGLSSYLLIGFFFHKHSAANANKKAFLANRVGDYGFWLGILTFFTATGTLNYFELFAHVHVGTIEGTLMTWAGIGLFMGCVGKSAQMPLHIWLPDAMEGPTPVSALIHAATMVAAGVYMVARLAPLFGATALLVVMWVGAITAFLAAMIALVKTDIKRVLAFSTLSQLGYMVLALGVGDSPNAMFHLTTHAMFKGLLFLCAGSVIHAVHSQEMTDMGALRKKMPITFITFLIGTMALSGVPFLAGFYSKDGILGSALAFGMVSGQWYNYVPFGLAILAAVLTPFYMFRLVFRTFFGKPADQDKFDHAHESGWNMTIPLMILATLSICAAGWQTADKGWFAKFTVPYDVTAIAAEFHLEGAPNDAHAMVADPGEGHGDTHAVVEPGDHGDEHAVVDPHAEEGHGGGHDVAHTAHVRAMYMSIAMVIIGIGGAWLVYHQKKIDPAKIQARMSGMYTVLQGQYFFDEFYAATVYRFTLWLAWLMAAFDRVVIDGIVNGTGYLTRMVAWVSGSIDKYLVDGAVNGVATVLQGAGEGFRRIQTGRIQTYLTYTAASVLVLILIYRVL
ncbi:MAG: NADH-quinone oxidoreductase subunit L [Candidatus Krumholzibacteria bacterium]|nr:NADH-quinone oxidoreductase subunit L [Candidatus Krumholzibacteria bacterium]